MNLSANHSDSNPERNSLDETLPAKSPGSWVKLCVLVAGAIGLAVLFVIYRDAITLENLAQHESTLRAYQDAWYVMLVAFVLYVAVTAVSLPGAVPLTLTYGWYFGFFTAVVIVSFASTAGATLAFLSSRYLFREAIQRRFGQRYATINQALEEEGAFYLFTLRLVPLVPFFVINLVMGLTPMKTSTFWWVSQLGMLAGTAVYTYAGASVPSLGELAAQGVGGIFTFEIAAAFLLLGIFPILVKRTMALVRTKFFQST